MSLPRLNVSPGAILKLTIDDIAFGGEGVGRVDDFVVFVPFVAQGEVVEAEVISNQSPVISDQAQIADSQGGQKQ